MQDFFRYLTPTALFAVITVLFLLLFTAYYWYTACPRPRKGTLEWIALRQKAEAERSSRRLCFASAPHPMVRKDWLLALLITACYAVTAFWSLGDLSAPQSYVKLERGQSVAVALEEEAELSSLLYYPWLGTGSYTLEGSIDGESWFFIADVGQSYTSLYKWIPLELSGSFPISYLRLTAQPDGEWLELGELALFNEAGERLIPSSTVPTQPAQQMGAEEWALFDEQDLIPDKPFWTNSTYFDEIYHARTAQEHIQGAYPYEITHPPLGKLILGLGIRLFDMTPFGWRFMGTLFGALMLPLLYCLVKNLFGKTQIAAAGTILLAADFMHLTQTRIATIDTYGVFFILGMYYFLYRWLALPAGSSFAKGAPWLALSGLFWGLGAASKWTVIYGAVGLALLYFTGLWLKLRDWPQAADASPGLWTLKTLLFSVLCFVAVPAIIYCASYLPYAQANGDISLQSVISAMWDNQLYMFHYHQGVNQEHPYSSRWYQWIVDGRPILYYLDTDGSLRSSIAAFTNPVVCWGGLLALVSSAVQLFRRRSGKALFLLVGYFSQLAPWFAIGRTTFAYHYFPSILFLILAMCFLFDGILTCQPVRGRLPVWLVTGGAVLLYALFYPVLTGIPTPIWYARNLLQWLPSWPL